MTTNKQFDNEDAHMGKDSEGRASQRRVDWDVRGILAVLSLCGTFTLAGALLFLGKDPEIPAWAAAVVSTVLGFYFGSRSAGNG